MCTSTDDDKWQQILTKNVKFVCTDSDGKQQKVRLKLVVEQEMQGEESSVSCGILLQGKRDLVIKGINTVSNKDWNVKMIINQSPKLDQHNNEDLTQTV